MAAATLVLALGISACGSSSDDSGESSDTGTTTSTTQAPANAQSVRIGLTEMAISASPDSVKAGDVAFDVTNDGNLEHEL
ncbi:MAG TPA: hypothetical protein PLV77_06305, partial [Solirubrobacterales bacterium]|nr:hypothetical protein [Solirubrobacterales bacterium]